MDGTIGAASVKAMDRVAAQHRCVMTTTNALWTPAPL